MHSVAIVAHSVSLYGASRSLVELARGLRGAGLRICVILPSDGPLANMLRALGIDAVRIPFTNWVASAAESGSNNQRRRDVMHSVSVIARFLEQWGADVVWSNSSVTPIGALAAKASGLPHIWHLRELWGGTQPFTFEWDLSEVLALLNGSARRIAVSEIVKRHYEALGCHTCDFFYNGIGDSRSLMQRSGQTQFHNPTRLLLVGRVRPLKKQTVAITAVRILLDEGYPVQLRIVGDGDLEPCRDLIEHFRLSDHAQLVGFRVEVEKDYEWADIALNCSSFESMGRTTVEAMSYGLPVVGDHRYGTGELIRHRVNGLHYDGSAENLAHQVTKLIDSPTLTRRLGQAGRNWAQSHFNTERYVENALGVLGDLSRLSAPRDSLIRP